MSSYHKEGDIGRLLKEIQFENCRLQKVAGDIKQLLRDAKRLFQQIKKSIDQYETGRRLFLGQLKKDGNSLEFNGINQEFQNVADVTPTPNPLAPLTLEQRTLIREITTQGRQLRALRLQLATAIGILFVYIDLFERNPDNEEYLAAAFAQIGQIRRIRAEYEEARDNLATLVIELAISIGALEL